MSNEKIHGRISTGIQALDQVLSGGLQAERAYLVRGGPGTGKTTLGMHFLMAGNSGEKGLFITLSETEIQLRTNAHGMGFDLSQVEVLDLTPTAEVFSRTEDYDIFAPEEVERDPTTRRVLAAMRQVQPKRVVIDSMTQLRYLTASPFHFRKQVLALLRFLTERGCTVIFISEVSPMNPDDDMQFLADGIIDLDQRRFRRYLEVLKFRGSSFLVGQHTMRITNSGIELFPRLLPDKCSAPFAVDQMSSGIPAIDALTHGGLERGTVTIVTGPSGGGKTTFGLLFIKHAADRGEHSVIFAFEETCETLMARSEAINIPVRDMMDHSKLTLHSIEPLDYSPDQFAALVRHEVEKHQAKIIMIDSIAGYRLSVALEHEELHPHLHALCRYLSNLKVTTLLINEVEAITGDFYATEVGISYLADSIIFIRYLEMAGEMRKAVGVLKKRVSDFEKTLREFSIDHTGIKVGKPLAHLRGILRGVPEWVEQPEKIE